MDAYNNMVKICITCKQKYTLMYFIKIIEQETNICDQCVKCNKDKSVKICTKCDSVKLLTEFQSNNKTKDGLSSWCRPCYSQYKKIYNAQNKEILTEKRKVWNHTQAKIYNQQYYNNHKEYYNNYYKKYNADKKLQKKLLENNNDALIINY